MSSARLLTSLLTQLRRHGVAIFTVAAISTVGGACTPDFTFPEDATGGGNNAGGEAPGDGGNSTGSGARAGTGGELGGAFSGDGGTPGAGGSMPPDNHCESREIDFDETYTDCGGRDCPPCATGLPCKVDRDCEINSCIEGECQMPSCRDGERNGQETDLNCGGPDCGGCAIGMKCGGDDDCDSLSCVSGKCVEPTCLDRRANGSESDINCGGPDCEPCDIGRNCTKNADCVPAPEGDFSVSACEEGTCVLKCPPNKGDCNSSAQDGCETDLGTTLSHCGACNAECKPTNAQGQCVAGNCQLIANSCTDGFANCNGSPTDGCEVDLALDPNSCGSCDVSCSDNNGTPGCSAGECTITCEDDFADCNGDSGDGCEANLEASTVHCGGCGIICRVDPGNSATCDEGICGQVACPNEDGCNGESPCGACQSDLICDDLLSSVNNCGGCGISCSANHGTPSCEERSPEVFGCVIDSCELGYADCDGSYYSGCEVNTNASNKRCGGCLGTDPQAGAGEDCSASVGRDHIAETSCAAGDCAVTSCDSGWADCDGDFENGCEVDINLDGVHCGGCSSGPTVLWDGGVVCDGQFPGGSGSCEAGHCLFASCDGTLGDCNGDIGDGALGDGCETETEGNPAHCGACGVTCSTPSGTLSNSCSGSGCVPTCGTSFGSCDGIGSNGCEADLRTTTAHCGACNNDCAAGMAAGDITAVACIGRACSITACESDFGDCNQIFSDGCESPLDSAKTNCGSCGNDCTASEGSAGVATTTCGSGSCEVASCAADRADCNGTFGDGCEINTLTSTSHCGGCNEDDGIDCGTAVGYYEITGASCGGGECQVAACSSGYADCNLDLSDGCEVPISTDAVRCGGCLATDARPGAGETCQARPHATPNGCSSGSCDYVCDEGWLDADGSTLNGCETRELTLVNSSPYAHQNTGTGTPLVIPHTLEREPGTQRLLLVGVLCKGNTGRCLPTTATYGAGGNTINLTTLGSSAHSSDTQTVIFYALDETLPAAGDYQLTLLNNFNNYNALSAQVLEFNGAEQSTFFAAHTNDNNPGANCGNNQPDTSATLNNLPTNSLIYAVVGGPSNDPSGGYTDAYPPMGDLIRSRVDSGLLFGTAVSNEPVGTSQVVEFDLDRCNESKMYTVGIRPESDY